ncbi:MAG: amidase [Actinomycetota bacterium]|nr:amidase [Actinomycetota bacterium]
MDTPSAGGPGKLNRRSFIKYSAAAGAAAGAATRLGMSPASAASRSRTSASTDSFEWSEATIAELQAAMASGRITAKALTAAYIERIEDLDLSGPQLNSVIEINPAAEAIAEERDRERRAGHARGPLHGIPILLKDNVATLDRMQTTAGSLALLGSKVPRDAGVAHDLRRAGAILLGKANLSEWANFRSFQSSSGWSGRAGQVLNPYALDHNACGSSSGSAAAVAANFAAGAIGTETDGSIVCPSATCGVVGIKPTLGLTSRSGVVPIAHSQDVTGPMCRTVADAATMLGALTGVDPFDPATKKSVGHFRSDYRKFLKAGALKGARIGIWREGNFGISPESDAVVEDAIGVLHDAGATVVDPADIPHSTDIFDPEFTVLLYEFKHDIAAYLSGLSNTSMHTLADLIAFNKAHADLEMPWFGQELFELAETFGPLTDRAYRDALHKSKRLSRHAGIVALMDAHNLDAIFAPTGNPSWTIDLVNGDHFLFSDSSPAAVAGFPHITVPAGYTGELPIGVSFMGKAWTEPKLISYAYSFEQATKARHAPKFLKTYAVRDFIPRATHVGSVSRSALSTGVGVAATAAPEAASRRPFPLI